VQVTSAERSAAATARRAQIVSSTIEVIAESGYGQASFARIAEHAGLSSTRLISYHFAGKGELIAAVAGEVMASVGAFMAERRQQLEQGEQHGAAAQLRAYIEGVVAYVDSHQPQMKALTEILLAGTLDYDAHTDRRVVSPLEQILRDGQASGEFRDFDPVVTATAIQRAIDALPFLLASTPDLDCEHYAHELVTLFELGTRSRP